MPVPKANQRAVNKYVKNNYDRINVTMPKGKKETIQAHAEAQGQSVNAYINAAIDSRIAQEDAVGPQEAGVVSLPSDTLKAAQRAAEARGESVNGFVNRAILETMERDKAAPAASGEPEKHHATQ